MNSKENSKDLSEELSFEFWFRINKIAKEVADRCYNKNGRNNKDALTMPQYAVMEILDFLGPNVILKDLAEKNGISKAALSIMLTKLESDEMIKKINDKSTDKRKVNIVLTKKGKDTLKAKKAESRKVLNEILYDKASKEDIEFMREMSPRIIEILRKFD